MLRRAKSNAEIAATYDRLGRTVQVLASWPILPFDESAIGRFDKLRSMKLNVGMMDLRIAAIALEQSATLVTRNTRDFSRIPGLTIEDWTL